jgi:catechol 2,3-dioxygenase-like lactoylglutathione lyase family enzyme
MALELRHPDYIVVIVASLDRALPFYTERLGLKLKHRSGSFAQLATGATRLGLFERAAMAETLGLMIRAPAADAPGFEIGFMVENVDDAFAELVAAGVPAVATPRDRAWGQRTAYVRDPDGHLIELVQRLPRDD